MKISYSQCSRALFKLALWFIQESDPQARAGLLVAAREQFLDLSHIFSFKFKPSMSSRMEWKRPI